MLEKPQDTEDSQEAQRWKSQRASQTVFSSGKHRMEVARDVIDLQGQNKFLMLDLFIEMILVSQASTSSPKKDV